MKLITTLLVLFGCQIADAQIIETRVYYNAQWEITNPNSLRYYRDCTFDTVKQVYSGEFTDYIVGDTKLIQGTYDEDGSLHGTINYFVDDLVVKSSTYDHGNLMEVKRFRRSPNSTEMEMYSDILIDGEDFFVRTFFDSMDNQIIYEGSGLWYNEQPGNTFIEGRFNEGKKEGAWRYRTRKGQIILIENYIKGKFKGAEFYGTGGIEEISKSSFTARLFRDNVLIRIQGLDYDIYASQKVYPFMRFLPENSIIGYAKNQELREQGEFSEAVYPGGQQALNFIIARNLQYPMKEQKIGVSGKVYLGFTVYEDGSFGTFEVLKGLSENCDKEALRVLSLMAQWSPATLDGSPVASKQVVPITFKLATQ